MPTNSRKFVLDHILALLAVLGVNYLAVALPLNGNTPGDLSDKYPNLFVPAGITFSIWGLIYTWLMVWVVLQVIALYRASLMTKLHNSLQRIGYWFVISCALNIAWLLAWHWEILWLSLLIMAALFLVLLKINLAIWPPENRLERNLAHIPFGIYFGWISVALIANASAFLVGVGWDGFGFKEVTWAAIMVSIGIVQAAYVVLHTDNPGYGFAVAWALLGIYLKRVQEQEAPGLGILALSGAGALLVIMALRWRRLIFS